jgi:hypothetical protein
LTGSSPHVVVLPAGGYAAHSTHEGEPIALWLGGLGVAARRSNFAVLGYAITSMETETYRPARLILLGEDATPELRRATSLDALVTPSSRPFFLWHTAEDAHVPPEHT